MPEALLVVIRDVFAQEIQLLRWATNIPACLQHAVTTSRVFSSAHE